MIDLLPCPFCGGEAELRQITSGCSNGHPARIKNNYTVKCMCCGASSPVFESDIYQDRDGTIYFEKNGAVDASEFWNRRVSDEKRHLY